MPGWLPRPPIRRFQYATPRSSDTASIPRVAMAASSVSFPTAFRPDQQTDLSSQAPVATAKACQGGRRQHPPPDAPCNQCVKEHDRHDLRQAVLAALLTCRHRHFLPVCQPLFGAHPPATAPSAWPRPLDHVLPGWRLFAPPSPSCRLAGACTSDATTRRRLLRQGQRAQRSPAGDRRQGGRVERPWPSNTSIALSARKPASHGERHRPATRRRRPRGQGPGQRIDESSCV